MGYKFLSVIAVLLLASAVSQTASARGGHGDKAFTVWSFIFNDPMACATTPCTGADLGAANGAVIYLTGQRVQGSGRAIFAGAISADSSHGQVGGPGAGLTNPWGAEIHFGLQSHGNLAGDPGTRNAQVTTPKGGCMPECGLVQAAIFLPGNDGFVDG